MEMEGVLCIGLTLQTQLKGGTTHIAIAPRYRTFFIRRGCLIGLTVDAFTKLNLKAINEMPLT